MKTYDLFVRNYRSMNGAIPNRKVKFRDVTGIRFGKLIAVRWVRAWKSRSNTVKRLVWVCHCSCGGERLASSYELLTGHVKSCGCGERAVCPAGRLQICPAFKAIILDHREHTTKSTAQIARYFGITKNAVIGILTRNAAMITEAEFKESMALFERLPKSEKKQPITFPGAGKCLWSYGNPGDNYFRWCGANTIPGKSWCRKHYHSPNGVFKDEKASNMPQGQIAAADLSLPSMAQKPRVETA